MTAFYNECDPYAAQWLENLIAAGHIASGIVDRRPIQEIEAFELAGFTQCHFFAGIGIWSLALRRAGWRDDRPIWTGSCPCQPFSNAGQRKGISDERHLWPYWFDLVAQCKPPTVVGEQVASKDGLGWLDLVSADMEGAGYAIGASDLCAAGFGQAHLRQRLYFVAVEHSLPAGRSERRAVTGSGQITGSGAAGGMGNPVFDGNGAVSGSHYCPQAEVIRGDGDSSRSGTSGKPAGATGGLADSCGEGGSGRRIQGHGKGNSKGLRSIGERSAGLGPDSGIHDGGLADDDDAGLEGRPGVPERGNQFSARQGSMDGGLADSQHNERWSDQQGRETYQRIATGRRSEVSADHVVRYQGQTGSLDDADWLLCRNPAGEPSWRAVEPGTFPLAHGVASRMGKLRAFGNALDAETATGFCEVVKEICDENGV